MSTSKDQSAWRFIDGPIGLAAVLTVGFYTVLSSEGLKDSIIQRYTSEHVTEYVIVAVLAWGVADLVLRCFSFRREGRAMRQAWLPERQGQEPAASASQYHAAIQEMPEWMRTSRLGRRLQHALLYVHEKQSADGLDDHLRDLSERDSARTHANYAVPRFVVWITPVLGFLGTVVHFGTALGSLSPDDLAKNLPLVVAGMGTAFDTTTMALASSVSIMLGMFLVERSEQTMVRDVDDWVERALSNRFAVSDASLSPFLDAVERSSRATLDAMRQAAQVQLSAWPEMLGQLRTQQDDWQRQQMESWSQLIAQQQEHDEAREGQFRKLLHGIAEQRGEHQTKLQATVDQFAGVQKNLGQLTETLASVLAGEGQLLTLQKSLSDNLRVLQQTQQFDQAVNGLTAAIHLLTVRQQGPMANKAA